MRLTREVRFSLADADVAATVLNSWAGSPGGGIIAPFVALRATVSGPVDNRTGYLCHAGTLDKLLRDRAIPHLQQAWSQCHGRGLPAGRSLAALWKLLEHCPPNGTRLSSLELKVTPFQTYLALPGEPFRHGRKTGNVGKHDRRLAEPSTDLPRLWVA